MKIFPPHLKELTDMGWLFETRQEHDGCALYVQVIAKTPATHGWFLIQESKHQSVEELVDALTVQDCSPKESLHVGHEFWVAHKFSIEHKIKTAIANGETSITLDLI